MSVCFVAAFAFHFNPRFCAQMDSQTERRSTFNSLIFLGAVAMGISQVAYTDGGSSTGREPTLSHDKDNASVFGLVSQPHVITQHKPFRTYEWEYSPSSDSRCGISSCGHASAQVVRFRISDYQSERAHPYSFFGSIQGTLRKLAPWAVGSADGYHKVAPMNAPWADGFHKVAPMNAPPNQFTPSLQQSHFPPTVCNNETMEPANSHISHSLPRQPQCTFPSYNVPPPPATTSKMPAGPVHEQHWTDDPDATTPDLDNYSTLVLLTLLNSVLLVVILIAVTVLGCRQ